MENAKLKVENEGKEIKAGDIVYLKSGGPAMVVSEIYEGKRAYNVCTYWFNEGQIITGLFNPATLTRSKPED